MPTLQRSEAGAAGAEALGRLSWGWFMNLKRSPCLESEKSLSCVQLFVTPWTIQFMDFSRPEYRSG